MQRNAGERARRQAGKWSLLAGRLTACSHDVCCLGWLDRYKYFRKKTSANKQTKRNRQLPVKQNSGAVSEAHQFY